MFEKLGQAAERAAIGVSRRQFLRRLGQGSLIAASGLAALLTSPGDALARRPDRNPCGPGLRKVACNYRYRKLCCPEGFGCMCYPTSAGLICQCE
jgi:hypothetical protein